MTQAQRITEGTGIAIVHQSIGRRRTTSHSNAIAIQIIGNPIASTTKRGCMDRGNQEFHWLCDAVIIARSNAKNAHQVSCHGIGW